MKTEIVRQRDGANWVKLEAHCTLAMLAKFCWPVLFSLLLKKQMK